MNKLQQKTIRVASKIPLRTFTINTQFSWRLIQSLQILQAITCVQVHKLNIKCKCEPLKTESECMCSYF